jgi:hypothetical protein
MRKFVVLLAVVGATVGVLFTQASSAFIIDGGREQCGQESPRAPVLWSGSNLRYDGQKWVDGLQKKESHAFVENDAEQSNEELCQEAKNEPFAGVHNKNKNFNPQFGLLFARNSSSNWQSNETWIDQSQHAKAAQTNVLWQGISVNGGPPGPGLWHGGSGAPLENDAEQENEELNQTAENDPFAWVGNKNVNFNPQFTLIGSNSSSNWQSNTTSIDQSQHVKAAQANVADQAIHVGPPIDPVNDAEQENEELNQEAKNEPKAFVDNKNVNFNPQFTLVGHNSSSNTQSNATSIDQSQNTGALQLNAVDQTIGVVGQTLGLG